MVASVAIVSEETVIAEYTMNHKKTHSETLLPMIDEILRTSESSLEELDGIAIASGPGSFTGLRIGAATAKGLAMAVDCPLIPVKTCEGLAYNMWGSESLICPIIDARRSQVYTGVYRVRGHIDVVMDQRPMDIHELISSINELGEDVIFLGDGVLIYEKHIWDEISVPCTMAPASMNRQRGASVATLGLEMLREGRAVNADVFAPEYLRRSQAERVRQEKNGS